MSIDIETKRKILDLYSNQHKTIREITKITRKSSRDIIAILKEQKKESREQKCEVDDKNQGVYSKEEPMNAKACHLYSQGKSPVEVLKELRLSEIDATKYYMEYMRLVQLPGLSLTFKELGSVRAVSYFSKLSNIAAAEQLTVEEVIRLLRIVKSNPLAYVEARIEEVKRMLFCLESELEEQKDALFHCNEKIGHAKLILSGWERDRKELREDVLRIYDEKQTIQNLVYEFKHNDKVFLNIQNVAEDMVKTFLNNTHGRKLLEFAFVAVCEMLRQDPQMELLVEKTPPIQNYDFNSSSVDLGQPPFPSPYDDYPHFAREKILELSNKFYNELVKGLSCTTMSTVFRIEETDSASYHSFFKPSRLSNQAYYIPKDMAESDVHEKCKGDIAP
jgi:hypothetical protein